MLLAVVAIAYVAQAHRAGHVLQLTIAIRRTGEAIQRMIGDVEFHHPLAQRGQTRRLRVHHQPVLGQGGARGGRATTAVDFHQAQSARPKGLQRIGGAQLRDRRTMPARRRHDRGALGNPHAHAIDRERYQLRVLAHRRSVVQLLEQRHVRSLESGRRARTEVLAEMRERAHDRQRRESAKRTQRRVG